MQTPYVQKISQLLNLMYEGYVLNTPTIDSKNPKSELTLPMNLDVQYEVPGIMWYVLEEFIERMKNRHDKNSLLNLRKVQLREPECGVAWVIVHDSNTSALRWQVTPQILYTEAMKNVVANLDADELEQEEELITSEAENRKISQHKRWAILIADVYLGGADPDIDN